MRRRLLTAVAAVALAGLVAPLASGAAAESQPATATPIEHFVVLMQENHSFDNYFGTYEGADGFPADTCMPVDPARPGSRCVRPRRLGDREGADLPQSASVGRRQINGGEMNGFISAIREETGRVIPQVMRYYDDRDIPYYWNVADNYVLFDRFFSSSRGGTLSNHMYWIAGQPGTARPGDESIPPGGFEMSTIFDRLEQKGISWKFYVENYDPSIRLGNEASGDQSSQTVRAPLLNFPRYLDDPDLFSRIAPIEDYYRDLERGTLPAVAYIAPSASSEHPPSGPQAGQAMVRSLISALVASDEWSSSAFMWTYDNWAGFYDHVQPPAVDGFGYGFRVPALLVSPYARRGYVEHSTLDFASILKFIETNWGVAPLAQRDAQANNLTGAFDFQAPPRPAELLDSERPTEPEPQPNRVGVYATYGLGLAAFILVLALVAGTAGASARRRAG